MTRSRRVNRLWRQVLLGFQACETLGRVRPRVTSRLLAMPIGSSCASTAGWSASIPGASVATRRSAGGAWRQFHHESSAARSTAGVIGRIPAAELEQRHQQIEAEGERTAVSRRRGRLEYQPQLTVATREIVTADIRPCFGMDFGAGAAVVEDDHATRVPRLVEVRQSAPMTRISSRAGS